MNHLRAPSSPAHQSWLRYGSALCLALLLTACGGGGSDDPATPPEPPPPPPVQVGQLQEALPLKILHAQDISAALSSTDRLPALQPRYDVATYRLTYLTQDLDGALVTASGLVAVPQKTAGSTSPVISYQHATTFNNADAPSLHLTPSEPPLVLASLGYIVVAADYVGFGASNALPHPYLQARPTARAVLDLLTAAQQWRTQNAQHTVADNGQLYLLGYSEGGYATMAAHREIERSASPLRAQLQASLPAAGPYDMQVTLDTLLERVRDAYPAIGWMLRPGTLKHLGSATRAEVRRALLRQLVPDDADVRYDARVLDDYLADDQNALLQYSSVHEGWTPSAPVYLFHGRDDETVPFAASLSARDTLQARAGASVTLRECTQAQPSGHTACVPEYFSYALETLGRTARGL